MDMSSRTIYNMLLDIEFELDSKQPLSYSNKTNILLLLDLIKYRYYHSDPELAGKCTELIKRILGE